MQTKLLSGILILGLLAVSPLKAAAPAIPPATANGTIVAKAVKGEVIAVSPTGVRTRIENNSSVAPSSDVLTGKDSSVVLVFSNGATVNLGSESDLNIEKFTQDPFGKEMSFSAITEEPTKSNTKLKLNRGELVGKVAKLKKDQGSTFDVSTPVGAAGIRGTTFRIVYRPDGTGKAFFSMTTLEGNVEVTLAVSGQVNVPVTVGDNKEITVDVNVTVDPKSGQTTITSTTGQTIAVVDAPPSSTQPIVVSAATIAQAVIDVVVPPTGNGNNGNSGNGSGGNNDNPSSSPNPTPNPTRTTTGDGKT